MSTIIFSIYVSFHLSYFPRFYARSAFHVTYFAIICNYYYISENKLLNLSASNIIRNYYILPLYIYKPNHIEANHIPPKQIAKSLLTKFKQTRTIHLKDNYSLDRD